MVCSENKNKTESFSISWLSARESRAVFVSDVLEFIVPEESYHMKDSYEGFSARRFVNAGYNFDFIHLYERCRGSVEDKIMIRSFQ